MDVKVVILAHLVDTQPLHSWVSVLDTKPVPAYSDGLGLACVWYENAVELAA